MIESLSNPQVWIGLGTLTFLEIVLGVDNVIFVSILSGKLPEQQQARARRLGLLGAMLTRILLLFSLALGAGGTVLFLSSKTSAVAVTFTITDPTDAIDANPGDGV